MEKLKLIILVIITITGKLAFSQENSKEKKFPNSEMDDFYWIDTLKNGKIETYDGIYFYKNTSAANFPIIVEQKAYFSELYDHFEKQLNELGKIIEFGKRGYEGVKVISDKIDGKKSCNCILLSLHNQYTTFNSSKSVLMVIKNKDYILKVICPLPW